MNTSQPSTLSAEQLEAFVQGKLSAEETKRVQHLLNDCELSKEALEGYSVVPGAFADVAGLKKSIAAKSGMTSLSWSTIGLSVVAIAALSFAVNVFINNDVTPEPKVVQTQDIGPDVSVAPAPANILSPADDHFVNPEANGIKVVVPSKIPGSGESKDSVLTFPNEVLQPIPADSQQKILAQPEPIVTTVKEVTYNAQVGYIVDLKVTDFDKYYTTQMIDVNEPKLGGVPAEFEDQDVIKMKDQDGETVHSVPAAQFLREGLLAFRDARYGKCVSKMDVLLTHNPDDINAMFYTAVSYVKLEMYSKAIPLLDKIISDPNNVFDEEAEWYKALALEGNGDSAAANALFQKIANDGGFYSKQASGKLR